MLRNLGPLEAGFFGKSFLACRGAKTLEGMEVHGRAEGIYIGQIYLLP